MRTVPPTQNNYLVAPGTTWTESSAFVIRKYFPDNIRSRREQFEAYSGTAFGILFAIALTGGMLLPWAVTGTSVRTASGSASGGC